MLFRAEVQLAEVKLQQWLAALGKGGQRTAAKWAVEFPKKWIKRTTCHAGYVAPDCREYKGPLPRGRNLSRPLVATPTGSLDRLAKRRSQSETWRSIVCVLAHRRACLARRRRLRGLRMSSSMAANQSSSPTSCPPSRPPRSRYGVTGEASQAAPPAPYSLSFTLERER